MTDIAPDSITPPIMPTLKNDKRERKHTAQSLPPGITHNMMKKFVVYYREMTYLKSGKHQPREYFKVESHPKLSKPWVSSKSTKITLFEKLNDANQVVADLEAQTEKDTGLVAAHTEEEKEDIAGLVERWSKQLPKYMMLRVGKTTPTPTPTPTHTTVLMLVYDRKDNQNGFRWTSSYTFSVHSVKDTNTDGIITAAISTLREKLHNKYNVDVLSI
jgi:hypothetical protein